MRPIPGLFPPLPRPWERAGLLEVEEMHFTVYFFAWEMHFAVSHSLTIEEVHRSIRA
jgi:hypothetical protein